MPRAHSSIAADAGAHAAARLARLDAVYHGKPDNGRANQLDDVDHRPRIGVKQGLIVRRNRGVRGISLAAQGIA